MQPMITVIASNLTRVYGVSNPPLTGILLGVMSGNNITASYAVSADASSPPGTYAIVPALTILMADW